MITVGWPGTEAAAARALSPAPAPAPGPAGGPHRSESLNQCSPSMTVRRHWHRRTRADSDRVGLVTQSGDSVIRTDSEPQANHPSLRRLGVTEAESARRPASSRTGKFKLKAVAALGLRAAAPGGPRRHGPVELH
jgi:hypothetical protein